MGSLPAGPFSIIYADPPWKYDCGAPRGAAHKHYSTMSIDALCSLPVKQIAAKDSLLFMWTTWPQMPLSLYLMKSWGFEYKSCAFLWTKTNKKSAGFFFGMGRWTRGNTEPCLLGIRGKPKRLSASVRQIIEAPRGEHSAKPAETRDRILTLCGDKPRVELFARETSPGWSSWGDQLP